MNMQGLHYDLDSLFPEGPDFLQEEEICLEDYENMKRIYPAWLRTVVGMLEDYVDLYEYDGSILYHEYPDKVSVEMMAEELFDMIEYDGDEKPVLLLDIVKIMLCNEIYIRRRRHDRLVKRFHW